MTIARREPMRNTWASPTTLVLPLGAIRLIWATGWLAGLVAVVEGLEDSVELFPPPPPPPLTTRTMTTATTMAAPASNSAPPRRELGRGGPVRGRGMRSR